MFACALSVYVCKRAYDAPAYALCVMCTVRVCVSARAVCALYVHVLCVSARAVCACALCVYALCVSARACVCVCAGCALMQGSFGMTPLHEAAVRGHQQVVQWLVESGGADVAATDTAFGNTPLHWAAFSGDVDTIAMLLEAGAFEDARDQHGFTPLHAAAHSGVRRYPSTPATFTAAVAGGCRSHQAIDALACTRCGLGWGAMWHVAACARSAGAAPARRQSTCA